VLSWPITSFGLPVAMTTGRLLIGISTGVSHHAIRLAAVVTGLSMLLIICLTTAHLRRRRASRHGSNS
jgi:uncharacterized membrane protein